MKIVYKRFLKLIALILTITSLAFILSSCSFFQTLGSMIDGSYDYDKLIDNTIDKYMYDKDSSMTSGAAKKYSEDFFKTEPEDFISSSTDPENDDNTNIPKTSQGGKQIYLNDDVISEIKTLLDLNTIDDSFEYFGIDFSDMAYQGVSLCDEDQFLTDETDTNVCDKLTFEKIIRNYYGRTIANPVENLEKVTYKEELYSWKDITFPSFTYEILRIYDLNNDYMRVECNVTGTFNNGKTGTKNCIMVLKQSEKSPYGFFLIAQKFAVELI